MAGNWISPSSFLRHRTAHRELYTQLLPLHPRVQTQVITMSTGGSTGSCESDREPPVVLVLGGHSYIGSLNSFIERDPARSNLALEKSSVLAFLHDVGHTQPGNVFSASSQLDLVWELSPDAVVIDLGSNDLCELGATTESTVTALLDIALRVGIIPRLFVPKWKTDFNAAVHDTNRLLAKFLENLPNVHFWRHRAFTQNHSKLFMQDGVHFNEAGMLRYFRTIRGAVMKAYKMD
ncbi:uncharacterized protein [Diadema antillarum]|uniref:uncharacterized protein n=1 Tax=Diadema antillarum TaxID=105358 RepID=UPI003A8A7778